MGLIVDRIQVEGIADGHGDEGVARNEFVVRSVRRIRSLQNPNPFRVANHEVSYHIDEIIIFGSIGVQIAAVGTNLWLIAIGIVPAIAVEVEVKAEIIRAGGVVGNENRRTRAVIQVFEVLQKLILIERNATVKQMVIINICWIVTSHTGIVASHIDKIRRDEQAEVEGIGRGQGVGHDLRLGAGQRGIGRQPRAGGVGDGADGAAFPAAERQEGDGHERDHGQQNERDDQRNAALRRLNAKG